MKIITLLTVMFILFVPILNVSAASSQITVLEPQTVVSATSTDTTGDKSMLEQIKQYLIDIKEFFLGLPQYMLDKLKEYFPEQLNKYLN